LPEAQLDKYSNAKQVFPGARWLKKWSNYVRFIWIKLFKRLIHSTFSVFPLQQRWNLFRQQAIIEIKMIIRKRTANPYLRTTLHPAVFGYGSIYETLNSSSHVVGQYCKFLSNKLCHGSRIRFVM
jgi:hypothetical protein